MSTTYMCAHCGRTPGHVGVSFDDGWFRWFPWEAKQ